MNILTVNLLFSTLIFWVVARIYVLPRLGVWKPQAVLVPILLLHSFRDLGLMFVTQGGTYVGIPSEFAYPAAFGDLLVAFLSLTALFFVTRNMQGGRLLVWLFNIVGILDLLVAITLATRYNAPPYLGPAYWIPAFLVPALLVTHYITFLILGKYWSRTAMHDTDSSDHSLPGDRISSSSWAESPKVQGVMIKLAEESDHKTLAS